MTNDSAITDEMKSVERWENEGGRVSPLNHLRLSLKRFTTADNSRKGQMIDAQQSPQFRTGGLSRFNVRGAIYET